MKVKKCDRCGQLIPEEIHIKHIQTFMNQLVANAKAIFNPEDVFEITKNGENFDLCDDCYKSFENWLDTKSVFKILDSEINTRPIKTDKDEIKFGDF